MRLAEQSNRPADKARAAKIEIATEQNNAALIAQLAEKIGPAEAQTALDRALGREHRDDPTFQYVAPSEQRARILSYLLRQHGLDV